MKRIVSVLLTAMLLLSLIPVGAVECSFAARADNISGDYIYSLTNREATITGTNSSFRSSVTIPSTLNGYPVTAIAERAFSGCDKIETLKIPNSVKRIAKEAFYDCKALTTVTIGSGVTDIAEEAFAKCYALSSLTVDSQNTTYHSAGNCVIRTDEKTLAFGCTTSVIPLDGSVTNIGNYAFYGYKAFTSVTIPKGVTSIGEGAFESCGLTSVTIPKGVTHIGEGAFAACEKLTSVTIPYGVKCIGADAFLGCSVLKSVVIPDSVTSMGRYAFGYCYSLTSVAIGDGLQSIRSFTFYGCSSLTEVVIGDGLKSIEEYAFCDCSSLTSLTIPSSVTSIARYAFAVCSSLADVYYGGTKADRERIAISGNNEDITEATWHYSECKHVNTKVNGFVAPTCTEAGRTGSTVCLGCGQTVATGVSIPATGHRFGDDNLCDGCGLDTLLASYTYTITDGQVAITKVKTTVSGKVSIPATIEGYPVTAIGSNALKGCVNITELTLSANIQKIAEHAFRGCTALTTVHFNAESCSTMGSAVYQAFKECTALATVYVGKEVTQIPANAFRDIPTLTTLYMTRNTKKINVNAFHNTGLMDVYYVGSASDWAAVSVSSYNNVLKTAVFAYNTPCFAAHDWTADCDSLCDLCGSKRAVSHADIVVDNEKEPTCTATGLAAGSHCAVCRNVIVEQQVIPVSGHVWNSGTVLTSPTATTNGSKKYTCTVCGATKTVVLTLGKIVANQYLFDGKVVPNAGLVQVEDAYYYVGSAGIVQSGRCAVSNTNGLPFERGIYYFFEDGKMNTEQGVYEGYYFNEKGKLTPYAGLIEWNGAKYYANKGGKVNAGGLFYISNLNGLLPKSCFRTFYPDGRLFEDTRIYDKDGYYYENGIRTPYAGMVEYEGHWYYVNDGGAYVKNRVQVLTNVNNSGLSKNRRCYFDANGRMVTNTVVKGAYYGATGEAPDYAGVVQDMLGNLYYVSGVHGAVRKSATFTIALSKTNGLCAAGKYTADAAGKLTLAV